MHLPDRNWHFRIVIGCILVILAATLTWADDERPVVDDSQFGKDTPAAPATGRYFCLESIDAHDGQPSAAVAELDLIGADGKPLLHTGWTIAYVDSEERQREDGIAENAIDGQSANYWHTQWGDAQPSHPHRLVLDLGQSQTITAFRYVPRQGNANVDGRIKNYKIYVGDALVQKN